MGEKRNPYKDLATTPFGRPRCRLEGNIKVDLALVKTIMNLQVS
jgi:hypothetical protein